MTTGRINQVCQMLPKTVQPHATTWHGTAPAAKSTQSCSQLTSAVLETKQALPSKRNSPLDANRRHQQLSEDSAQHHLPAHAWIPHAIKQSQYPKSSNDHNGQCGTQVLLHTVCLVPLNYAPDICYQTPKHKPKQ